MKNKKAVSVIFILAAASGWGIIGVFSRPLAAAGLTPIQITFVRNIITAVLMGIFLLVKDRSLLKIRVRDIWIFLGSGLLSIVFFNVCYFLTIERTTLAAASILLYTAPCFVMLISAALFKEKITAQKLIALALAFAGCVPASGFAGGGITPFALMTGLGSGIGYALYSIFGKIALKRYSPFTTVFYTFAVAAAGLLPFSDFGGIVGALSGGPLLTAAGLGVISTFLPFIFYTYGLEKIDAGKASVLAFAEPMIATAAGIVIFSESLTLKNAAGILMIFAAIVLLNIPLGKSKKTSG